MRKPGANRRGAHEAQKYFSLPLPRAGRNFPVMNNRWIYHLSRRADWARAKDRGQYEGSTEDRVDGFLHFSTATQVVESARKHRAGETGLVLLEVDAQALGDALKWEPSRGGDLFPHLYGPLPVDAATGEFDLPLGPDGNHVFPTMKND